MKEQVLVFSKGFGVGLRKNERRGYQTEDLTESAGAVPEFGILHSVEDITPSQIDLASLNCSFPFPQVFMLRQITLVCTQVAIYEYVNGSLNLLIGSLTPGTTWSYADYGNYIALSNGQQIVVRDGISLVWAVQSDNKIPSCACLCDVNGQLFVGGLS